MVQTTSLFSQLLKHFPRAQFQSLVKEHGAERAAKGFTCWTQFVSMLFCHMAQADSLREICNGLACCLGKLTHLGIAAAPKKSTLSYANKNRPAAFFEARSSQGVVSVIIPWMFAIVKTWASPFGLGSLDLCGPLWALVVLYPAAGLDHLDAERRYLIGKAGTQLDGVYGNAVFLAHDQVRPMMRLKNT